MYFKKTLSLIIAATALTMVSCSNDEDWTPGPVVTVVDQVYFGGAISLEKEVSTNETKVYTLTLYRSNTSQSITVPLTFESDAGFTVPQSVVFNAGEGKANVDIEFKSSSQLGYYNCRVALADGDYNSPYTSLNNKVHLKVLVANWVKIGDLSTEFTYASDFWPSGATPEFMMLDDDSLQEGEEMFRIKNMFEDYDFTFKLDGTKYVGEPTPDKRREIKSGHIVPVGGQAVLTDPFEWGYHAWCFFDQSYYGDYDEENPDSYIWVVYPGLDDYFLYNPFIIDDDNYTKPELSMSGKYINIFIGFELYTTDWDFSDLLYYENFVYNW